MSDDHIPADALAGLSMAADAREIAAHYDVTVDALRAKPTDQRRRRRMKINAARAALMYRLHKKRCLSLEIVARFMSCTRQAVHEGAAKHEQRIADFHETRKLGSKT